MKKYKSAKIKKLYIKAYILNKSLSLSLFLSLGKNVMQRQIIINYCEQLGCIIEWHTVNKGNS